LVILQPDYTTLLITTSAMPSTDVHFESKSSAQFAAGGVIVVCAYGLLLIIPVILSMLAVSMLRFGIWTFLIPIAAVCSATYFLPFGFGNTHISRLVRSPAFHAGAQSGGFIVQLTFNPRMRSGLRALLEDADDIGWLTISDSELVFTGDSIRLSIPRSRISRLRAQSIGWRGLFVYPRVVLSVSGLPQVSELRFADRSSLVLPTARRKTRELYQSLSAK
jgi:hypothetical protein